MKPKKINVITFRVNDNIKEKINLMAEQKEWSISKVIEKICEEYFKNEEKTND